jgi:integrase
MANDLVDKDYSEFVKANATPKEESIHSSYTDHEIKLLWDNLNLGVPLRFSAKDIRDVYPVDIILMMIYTGVRPSELLDMETANVHLEKRYMVGGNKTDAGKGRVIPIHDDVFDLFAKRYNPDNKYLIGYKSDNPPTLWQYRKYMFDPIMEKLDISHLPHDGRHTFATYADRANINEVALARIMGHKLKSLTKQVYTHKEIEELIYWSNQITFVEK